MSSLDEFINLIGETDVVKEVTRAVKLEPAKLLCNICVEYQKTSRPVPDHNLNLVGYLRDVALRALLSAGMIEEKTGGSLSLYEYEPTEKGCAQFAKIMPECNY